MTTPSRFQHVCLADQPPHGLALLALLAWEPPRGELAQHTAVVGVEPDTGALITAVTRVSLAVVRLHRFHQALPFSIPHMSGAV